MRPDVGESQGPRRVEAALSYLVYSGKKPVNYPSVGSSGSGTYSEQYEDRVVPIHNARGLETEFDLDRQGFTLRRHVTQATDFFDEAEVRAIYDPEVEHLIKEATGAARVVVFDHTRRAGSEATRQERNIREPVRNIHNDYTDRSGPQRVRDLLPAAEAEELLKRRFAIINVWRPINEPVRTAPLALCDARSVAPEDLIASERRTKDRVGEIHQVVFNPNHHWYYFPQMRRDEVLLIKTYDSETDGRARFTIHTAFNDPTAPADAPARLSIESRTFAFF
jgi:hypothetical protein